MTYNVPIVDFVGPLTNLGANLGRARRRSQLQDAFADFNGNYDEAANKLMQMGLVDDAARLYTAGQLAKYRDVQGQVALDKAQPSLDERMAEQWFSSQQPSRLGPDVESAVAAEEMESQGSGVPGVNITQPSGVNWEGAPGFITDKYAPKGEAKRQEVEGTKLGERNAFRSALTEAAPQINELVSTLVGQVRDADPGTFANALGPLQGVPPSEDWRQTLTSGIPQALGAAANYFEKGSKEGFLTGEGKDLRFKEPGELGGGFTDTLRTQILSTQASLVGAMQRLLRVPGIGAQSDYELRQIIAQAGELSKARTKEDFQDRLKTVLGNLKAIGIPLNIPSVEQVAGSPQGGQVAGSAEPTEAPAVNKVRTFSVDPMSGNMAPTGVQVPGATRNPNGAYAGPAPAGTVMSNGTRTIIKGADGRWYDQKTKKPLAAPRP
jgi:hypothetical protein